MKTSLSHLPAYVKTNLKQIISLILANLPRCEIIIPYGISVYTDAEIFITNN